LQTVNDVQDDLAVIGVDGVVGEIPTVGVAAPDPKVRPVAHDVLAVSQVLIRLTSTLTRFVLAHRHQRITVDGN